MTTILSEEGVKTAAEATLYLERLLLRLPVKDDIRAGMVKFLEDKVGGLEIDYTNAATEWYLRELAHLIMSSPEFQLS